MKAVTFSEYRLAITVNGNNIKKVRIGKHYELKHGHYLDDQLILDLVQSLDGEQFKIDSITNGIEYYAADVMHFAANTSKKIFRLIWLFEGDAIDVLGVVNAYRRKNSKKENKK
jgi:hypothetical protein